MFQFSYVLFYTLYSLGDYDSFLRSSFFLLRTKINCRPNLMAKTTAMLTAIAGRAVSQYPQVYDHSYFVIISGI